MHILGLVLLLGLNSTGVAKQSKYDFPDLACERVLTSRELKKSTSDLANEFLYETFKNFRTKAYAKLDEALRADLIAMADGLDAYDSDRFWAMLFRFKWVGRDVLQGDEEPVRVMGQFSQNPPQIEMLRDLETRLLGRLIFIHELQHAIDFLIEPHHYKKNGFRNISPTWTLETRAFTAQTHFLRSTFSPIEIEGLLNLVDLESGEGVDPELHAWIQKRTRSELFATSGNDSLRMCHWLLIRGAYRGEILKDVGLTKHFVRGVLMTGVPSGLYYLWDKCF